MTTFNLNGRDVTVSSEDDTPLLWVVRDELGLIGTKFGCGAAQWGAGRGAGQRPDVGGCGFCKRGKRGGAGAPPPGAPAPSDDDIDTAMSGNICRCNTYQRIRLAIHDAAATLKG